MMTENRSEKLCCFVSCKLAGNILIGMLLKICPPRRKSLCFLGKMEDLSISPWIYLPIHVLENPKVGAIPLEVQLHTLLIGR